MCQWRCLTSASPESNVKGTERLKEEGPPQAAPANDATASAASDDALSKAEHVFKEEKEKLMKQLEDTSDKYKRALAETENVRQRMQKQIDDAKLFGIQGFCKDLLEVADILGSATESVPQDQLSNPHIKVMYEGLQMTDDQLKKVFTRHGLVAINPEAGEKFDPNVHEALFQSPLTEGKEPGTVAVVTKHGYRLHNRTLRAAVVGVFKGS